ncbi:MAG: hypothetical protein QM756_43485 [Polyangiaceae bacterium]
MCASTRKSTNSDTTTREGEWTFADAEAWLAYVRTVRRTPSSHTDLMLRLPSLSFPTSKNSWSSGRTLGLGAGFGADHELPLRGSGHALSSALLRPRVVYTYQLVDTPVATNSGFAHVRLDPDGRSLPSDQLSGAALPSTCSTCRFASTPRCSSRCA